MILLFLPALFTFAVMLVLQMAPIFHFAPSGKRKVFRLRSVSRLTMRHVRQTGENLQEPPSLELSA